MRDFHIACAQFEAQEGDKAANVARMVNYAAEARDRGCDLVLFPELIVTGYLSPNEVSPLVEPVTGPSVQRLCQAAQQLGIAIAFGLAELDVPSGRRYNSLVAVDREGGIAGVYRKMHLWATEKEWATGGDKVAAFEIADVTCSGWICYDTRFPELARMSRMAGADLALVATAWLGPGEEWELALRARALDNSMFVAGADIISVRPGLECRGLSLIVGPKGEVLARAEPGREGVIDAVLQDRSLSAQRGRVPLLRDRRPDRYDRLAAQT